MDYNKDIGLDFELLTLNKPKKTINLTHSHNLEGINGRQSANLKVVGKLKQYSISKSYLAQIGKKVTTDP